MNFYFATFSEFVQMGTHGPYVWACYFLMLAVLFVLGISPNLRTRQLKKSSRSRKPTAKSTPTESGSDHASAA
ncbi:MAG: hypothetical protein RL497_548 [Pseudomonadota bacterium]|jgi:heme exporter protein D